MSPALAARVEFEVFPGTAESAHAASAAARRYIQISNNACVGAGAAENTPRQNGIHK